MILSVFGNGFHGILILNPNNKQDMMKRVFGTFEAVFDIFYLTAASILGFVLLFSASGNSARALAGTMAFILVGGDAFHLLPRIAVIWTGREEQLRRMLGRGKQLTSIGMTLFYLFLWQIGILTFSANDIRFWSYTVYILAAMRILLCLPPHNKWEERYPPVVWGIARNIPFFLLGAVVAVFYFLQRGVHPGLGSMWFAITLSFAFYFPVVVWANKYPKTGMLMLPKTCAYLWMLAMCMSL